MFLYNTGNMPLECPVFNFCLKAQTHAQLLFMSLEMG